MTSLDTPARPARAPRGTAKFVRLLLNARVCLFHRALDDRLARGVDPATSAVLRLRAHQLTAAGARSRVADALERAVRAAEEPSGVLTAAVPVRRRQVEAARSQLVALIDRLRAPRPVRAQGVAIVLQMLVDAGSPLYQEGCDLRGAAAAAMEALGGRRGETTAPGTEAGCLDTGPPGDAATGYARKTMCECVTRAAQRESLVTATVKGDLVSAIDADHAYRVLLLPGSVLPPELAYGALIAALGPRADAVAKDLEVYASETPPADYTLDTEVAGVLHMAAERGWDRFHLVGYSGGGASALAFAAKHGERLLSLALLEPAWAGGWDLSPAERELWRRYDQLAELPNEQFMAEFTRIGLRSGVAAPPRPDGPPPRWMAKRPAGIRAFLETFKTYQLEREALRRFQAPVYFALGGLSNPDEYGEIAKRLSAVFPDFTLEIFEERHHFDPPHRIEPERVASSLLRIWSRAEGRVDSPGSESALPRGA